VSTTRLGHRSVITTLNRALSQQYELGYYSYLHRRLTLITYQRSNNQDQALKKSYHIALVHISHSFTPLSTKLQHQIHSLYITTTTLHKQHHTKHFKTQDMHGSPQCGTMSTKLFFFFFSLRYSYIHMLLCTKPQIPTL
jgi:hypothetical protein